MKNLKNTKPQRCQLLRLELLECRQLLAGNPLQITEFMASNTAALLDEDGDSSDWIEIHNPTNTAVSVDGWYLTDRDDNFQSWRFPDVTIPAGEYMVVFASGANRTNPSGQLHTGFKLNAGGEYLALVQPDRTVAHEFSPSFPVQTNDISYGLDAVTNTLGYLASPTPGSENSPLRGGLVHFSHHSTTFAESFVLTVTSDTPEAEIRYTLDGSSPTGVSFPYTGPLEITTSTQIRATAVAPSGALGPVSSASFVQLNDTLLDFTSNLPIVVLENFGDGRIPSNGDSAFKPMFMAIFEPNETGRSSLTHGAQVTSRAGVRDRGASTAGQPKPNYSVELWDETDDDQAISILGMPSEADWVFYAPYQVDPTLIRNAFVYELSNQVGRYAPRTRFVEVFTNTGGGPLSQTDYHGVYVVMEKIDRGPARVDVADLPPGVTTEQDITGGYIFKIDLGDPGDSGWRTKHNSSFWHVFPKEEEMPEPQRDFIRTYVDALEDALYGENFRDPEFGYRRFFDIDAAIDHHILQAFTKNSDALIKSTYLHKDRDGKIAFGPVWDFDRALGFDSVLTKNPIGWSRSDSRGVWRFQWWERLFEDPEFMQQWVDRYFELREDVLTEANLAKIVDRMGDQLSEAASRNFQRWPGTASGWKEQIANLKQWLTERIRWMDSRFLAPPAGSPNRGIWLPNQSISLSGGLRDVYYTTDGTDPRLPGGELRPGALRYGRDETYVDANSAAQYLIPPADVGETDWYAPEFDDRSWNSGRAAVGYDSGTTDIGIRTESGFTVRELQASIPSATLNEADLILQAGAAVINSETTVSDISFIDFTDNPRNGAHFDRNIPFPGGGSDDTIVAATATLLVESDATYTFGMSTDDGARLRINGANVIENTRRVAPFERFGTISLTAGSHTLDLLMFDKDGWTRLELFVAMGQHASFKEHDFQLLGENPSFTPHIQTDVQAEMRDVNPSLYLRIPFHASQAASVTRLQLLMRYDDGFVAYLNGTEVARRNAPHMLGPQSATARREDRRGILQEELDLSAFKSQLRDGKNVLAIHGLNAASDNGKFLLVPELRASLDQPIMLPGPGTITARVTDDAGVRSGDIEGSPWSPPKIIALTDQAIADRSNLRITELNYEPHDAQVQQGERDANNDTFEFIELMNVGPQPVELEGMRLVDGVSFAFAPQILQSLERLVVVQDVDSFRSRYGNTARIADGNNGRGGDNGEYGGRLANGGEWIKLVDRLGRTIQQFTYEDVEPWPTSADGQGSSLELIDVLGVVKDPHSWQPSAHLGGTPGLHAMLPGDLNSDDFIDQHDIDALFREVGSGTHRTRFDLNQDGRVDAADVDTLVRDILKTQFGDTNLDRRVDHSDFVVLAQNFGAEEDVGWSAGNFDGDDIVSFHDFVLLSNRFDLG